MTQLLRKWIVDAAVNSEKIDSSDSYTMQNLNVTTDATIGSDLVILGDASVNGVSKLMGNTFTSNLSVSGDATVIGKSYIVGNAWTSTLTVAGSLLANGLQMELNAGGGYYSSTDHAWHDGTESWADYGSITDSTGWSIFDNKVIKYKKTGKICHIQLHLDGTSDSTISSVTLPYFTVNTTMFSVPAINGGTTLIAAGYVDATSNVLYFWKDLSQLLFDSTGHKRMQGQFFYETI